MSEQKSSKRPPLPLVLTGNDLLSGDVVWFDGEGWSSRLAAALVALDDAAAADLDATLAASQREIVEPYLVTVAIGPAGEAVPAHYREKIRVAGPTFALAAAL